MSNAKRPANVRKVTTKTEANRKEALDQGVKITFEGQTYVLRAADITPRLARELRRETGHSFMRLLSLLAEDPDLDLIAEAIWVTRRIGGETVDLDEVALDYASLDEGFDIELAGSDLEAVDDGPEASGGIS